PADQRRLPRRNALVCDRVERLRHEPFERFEDTPGLTSDLGCLNYGAAVSAEVLSGSIGKRDLHGEPEENPCPFAIPHDEPSLASFVKATDRRAPSPTVSNVRGRVSPITSRSCSTAASSACA